MVDDGDATREVERLRTQLQVLAHAMRVFAEATSAPRTLLEAVARQAAEAAQAMCIFTITSPDRQWLVPAAIFDAGGGDIGELARRLVSVDHLRVDGPHPLARALQAGECAVMPAEAMESLIRARFARVEDQAAAIAVDVKGVLFVPLQAHGENVGAYSLIRYGKVATPFDDADVQSSHVSSGRSPASRSSTAA